MTLAAFIANTATLTPDTVKTWKQRGVDISATPFPADAISAKLEFLRKHVAAYAEEKKLDLSTPVVSISREKVGDFGVGELLVLASGHRLAAAACEFRVMEETLAPLEVPEAPAPKAVKKPKAKKVSAQKLIEEKPVAEAAAPKHSPKFSGIIDYSPAEVDDAIAAFLGNDL